MRRLFYRYKIFIAKAVSTVELQTSATQYCNMQVMTISSIYHLTPFLVTLRREQAAAEDISFRKLAVIEFLVKAELRTISV
jgi:hypothetical protein